MTGAVLSINAGSTSLKVAVHETGKMPRRLVRAVAKTDGQTWRIDLCGVVETQRGGQRELIRAVIDHVERRLAPRPLAATAHRIMEGGSRAGPAIATDELMEALWTLQPSAPLQQGLALELLETARTYRPELVHVACFDSAFHHALPSIEGPFPISHLAWNAGMRRNGLYGLSCQDVADMIATDRIEHERVIAAHIGGGTSLCAMRSGQSVATTMGMVAPEGMAMAPSLACGVNIRWLRETGTPEARLAIGLYAERVAQAAEALTLSLGGLDALVFTGGIGAHDAGLTTDIAERLGHLAPFEVIRHESDEECVMARQASELIQ